MSLNRFECMMPVNVTDAAERFETTELDAVSNLSGEYGIRIEEGDDYQVSAPSNWDADNFVISGWVIPDWDSGDGEGHAIIHADKDVDNNVLLRKDTTGDWRFRLEIGGTFYSALLTPTFSAGDALYIEARWDGTTMTLRVDTNQDGTLESATETPGATFGDNTGWTFHIGQDSAQNNRFEGTLNLLITDDGSASDPGDDRFNSGDGMALADWLATVNDGGGGKPHTENLVLHVGGNSDGSAVQLDSFASATQLLSDPEDGGYQFAESTTNNIDFGNDTSRDGETFVSEFLEIEIDAIPGSGVTILSRWNSGANDQKQFEMFLRSSGTIAVRLAENLTGGTAQVETSVSFSAGDRFLFGIEYNGGESTASDRLKLYKADYDAASRSYGSFSDISGTVTGTLPTTMTTPSSATDLRLGDRDYQSGVAAPVSVYDYRFVIGASLSASQFDARSELDQVYHDEWDHWWPLEGNANDQIGSLNGTITGATSVTDGRSLSGRFERFTRTGRYNFDGVDDEISLGNWQGLDGTTAFSMFGVFEVDDVSSTGELFTRWNSGDDAEKQLEVRIKSTGPSLNVLFATDLSGGTAEGVGDTVISAGDRYACWVRYDGGGAANADRLKMALAKYDPATGTYAAFSEETISFTGTIPTSLTTPSTSIDAQFGRRGAGTRLPFDGKIDAWRIDKDVARSVSTLNGLTVYNAPTGANFDHAWEFDGDATDAIGNLDGTVTGAQQVADGRQSTAIALNIGDAEVDRATGSSNMSEGVYGVRVKSPDVDDRVNLVSYSVTGERWYVLASQGRSASGSMQVASTGAGFSSTWGHNLATSASMEKRASAERATGGSTATFRIIGNQAGEEGYADNIRAYELATVSPSTATKALPTRVSFSVTKPGSGHPYVALALNGSEAAEAWARNDSGTQFGPAGGDTALSTGWHTISFGYDGTDLYVVVDGVKESTTVALSGNFDNLSETTIGAARLGVVSHFVGTDGDIKIGRVLVWDNNLTAEKRKIVHNDLRDTYTGLPEA